MKIKFTPSARGQFLDAIQYITDENPLGAQRLRARVEKELKRLTAFPGSGRKIPEFPELPHREIVVEPYRVFYRAVGDVIWWSHSGGRRRFPLHLTTPGAPN